MTKTKSKALFPSHRSDNRPKVLPNSAGSISDHASHIVKKAIDAVEEREDETFADANDDDRGFG